MSCLCSDPPRVSQCPGDNTWLWQPDVALINHCLLLVTFIPSPRIDQAQCCGKYTAQPEIQLTHPPPCPRSWQAWLLLLHQVSAQRSHDQKGLHWPASSSYPHSLFEHPSRCFKVYNKYCSGNILVFCFFFILILHSCYNLDSRKAKPWCLLSPLREEQCPAHSRCSVNSNWLTTETLW